ncbi:hypothetical protein F5Y08DRAFT_212671 [Xylaria arbuscula]|nr:hypothetical protein F5Y08DRAFT_212671 [Xylaria arbuscula]
MHTSADESEQITPIQHGPPYGSNMAVVGGVPTIGTDIPIAAILLALFVCSGAAHFTILQLNKRKGLLFVFSGMLFVMSVLRTVALSMRIVWATHPHTAKIAVASGILTQTGSVLVFVINLLFSQRVVRGYHPRFGWHPCAGIFFYFLIGCVVGSLVMVIVVTVQSVLTLDEGLRDSDRIVQLFAGTYMAVLAFLPIPIVTIAALYPRKSHVEKFGAGRWRTKLRLLLFAAAVATLGAGFRVATGYAARPVTNPAWYHSRVCYYCFNFVTDLIVSLTYLFSRFDRRFIVPKGAKGPGDYAKGLRDMPSVDSLKVDEKGSETDPEKLSDLRSSSNETGSEKGHLPTDDSNDEKREDKGKGKENIEGGEKKCTSPAHVDRETQTYGPTRNWNGVSWPFRASWTAPRIFGPTPEPLSANQCNTGNNADADSLATKSPVEGPSRATSSGSTGKETSSQWGAETTSTYIQEPEPIRFRTFVQRHQHHHHRHHQSQNENQDEDENPQNQDQNQTTQNQQQQPPPRSDRSYVFGQALTSDKEVQMSSDGLSSDVATTATISMWPFTSETQYRDPLAAATYTLTSPRAPQRSNSAAASTHPGSSSLRPPDYHYQSNMVGRSRSCHIDGNMRFEAEGDGGWI